jgi:hypothetical protein
MFFAVRAVHKFDFGLVINGTPIKWRPVKIFLTRSVGVCFFLTVVTNVKGLYPGQLHSLE